MLIDRQVHMMICHRGMRVIFCYRQILHHAHLAEQSHHTFFTSLHPYIDIACLAVVLVGIEARIRLSFQYRRLSTLLIKEFRQSCGLAVLQFVLPMYVFRLGRPLQQQRQRHFLARCSRINHAQQRLLPSYLVQAMPLSISSTKRHVTSTKRLTQ